MKVLAAWHRRSVIVLLSDVLLWQWWPCISGCDVIVVINVIWPVLMREHSILLEALSRFQLLSVYVFWVRFLYWSFVRVFFAIITIDLELPPSPVCISKDQALLWDYDLQIRAKLHELISSIYSLNYIENFSFCLDRFVVHFNPIGNNHSLFTNRYKILFKHFYYLALYLFPYYRWWRPHFFNFF